MLKVVEININVIGNIHVSSNFRLTFSFMNSQQFKQNNPLVLLLTENTEVFNSELNKGIIRGHLVSDVCFNLPSFQDKYL